MKAKLISLLLLIAMVISTVFTGCNKGINSGNTDETQSDEPIVFENNGMIAIRITPTMNHLEELIDAMIEINGCCDEVWVSVNFHHSLSDLSKELTKLAPIAKKLKDAGIRFVIENAGNLGHSADGAGVASFEKMVGSDGVTATSAYCPAGENFLNHMSEAIKIIASLKPYAIYLDDDFRLDGRGPVNYGCFCQNCINEFNSKYNKSYKRNAIVSGMLTDVSLREKYVAMNNEHMALYARTLSEAAMSVYPDVYIGWENAYLTNYLGDNYNAIFQAIYEATGKSPLSRPGAHYYNDHDPLEVFDKVLNTSWQNSIVADFVEVRRPEIENTTHTVMGKSLGGTLVEATLNLAYGANALSFSMCQSGNEPVSTRAAMWQAFRDYRIYWQGLIDDQTTADGEETGVAGLRLAYFQDMWKIVISGDSASRFFWANPQKDAGRDIIEIGLPITYEDDYCGAYLLHPDIIDSLTDENIQFLLTQNVYTDGASIQKLVQRGYGAELQITASKASYVAETYADHEANGRCAGEIGELDGYIGGTCYTFKIRDDGVALAYVYGSKQVSSVLVETKSGGTWIADGCDLWASIMNGTRRSRISIVAQYLSGDKLPARLDSDDRIALIVRTEKDGTFVSATLQNTTVGITYPIVVAVKTDADAKFVFSRPGYEDVECSSEYRDGEHFVSVPVLTAWQTGTLRVK